MHVPLFMQHETHMRHIMTSFLPPLAPPYFSTLSHKQHNFRKKVAEHKMCVLIFSTFVINISHSKTNSARYCHKCENVFMQSTQYSCRILIKLDFSRHILRKKSSNIKFHQNPSSGSRVVACGRTDRRS